MNAFPANTGAALREVPEPLDELLEQDDEAFVSAAYRRLLGRAPDATGLGNYVEKLRSGVAKTEILAELRQSDEYRSRLLAFPGMREALVAPIDTVPTVRAAATLQRLLAYHDRVFVACAYRTLLGREADPSGMTAYLSELRRGVSKLRILASLRRSAEGRRWAVGMPGLDQAIQRYRWAGVPVLGRVVAALWRVERETPIQMALRRVENRLYVLGGLHGGWGDYEYSPDAAPAAAGAKPATGTEATGVKALRPPIRPAGAALSVLRTLPNDLKKK